MGGQNMTYFDACLKYDYLPPIIDSLSQGVQLWDEFKKDSESWVGKNVIRPVRVGRNVGIGSRPDGGTMPAAGYQLYAENKFSAKYAYGRIQVSGPTIKASSGNAGAFAKAVASEVEDGTKDLYEDIDRQLCGSGVGTLAEVETAGTVTTLEVTYAGASSAAESGQPGTRYLKKGMLINIGTAAEHAAGTCDNATISSITDRDTLVIGSTTVADGDLIVRAGAATLVNSAYLAEIEGIQAFKVQTGTVQGIVYSTYPDFRMQYLDAAAAGGTAGVNRDLTQELAQQAIDEAEEFGGGTIDKIFCHTSMRREWLALCINDKRYMGTKNLDAGYTGELTFNGIPIKFVRQFPYNAILFATRSTWKIFPQGTINWMDDDGAILSRVANSDAMEGLLRFYLNASCSKPCANTWLCDINVTLRKT